MVSKIIKTLYDKASNTKELVSDVMNSEPHKISTEKTLAEASKQMLEYDCGFLVITDETAKAIGAITDRDIIIYGIAEGKSPETTTVKEVMSKELLTCYESETLEQAADHMSENGIRRLAVLNENDSLCGVISISDMIKHVSDDSINTEVISHLYKYA